MKLLKLIFMLLFATISTIAQTYNFGVSAGIGLNTYSSSFRGYEGTQTCCTDYDAASGSGIVFGAFGEMSVAANHIVGISLGINDLSADYDINQTIPVGIDGREVDGEFNFFLGNNIQAFSIQPYGLYKLTDFLYVKYGVNIALPLTAEFEKRDQLLLPDLVFEDGTDIYGNASGEIPDISAILFGPLAGIGAEYRFGNDDKYLVRGGAEITYFVNELAANTEINILQPSFNIGLGYSLAESKEIIKETVYKIDTVYQTKELRGTSIDVANEVFLGEREKTTKRTERSDAVYEVTTITGTDTVITYLKNDIPPPIQQKTLFAKLNVEGIDSDGSRIPLTRIIARTRLTKDIYPLLPYVFFEDGSSDIPVRYNTRTDINNFRPRDISPNPIDYHRNNLNFIGVNMADNPATKIEIIGYADRISENGNCGIAIRRAQAVKDYLTERFGINESRIVVKDNGDSCYPENETRTQSEQGFAENRRVEITSDQADRVFAVNRVSFSDPVRLSPEKLAIAADVYTETTYQGDTRRKNDATWKLVLGQNGQSILERDGFGNPDEQIIDLDRNIVSGLTEGKIDIELMGEYKYFKEQDAVEVEIVKDTLENEVQTLQLALFDVSSSRLSSDVKQSLRSFLSNLSDSAEITVSGYSDNLGDSESNKELSQVRAEAVAKAIREIAPQVQIKSIEGYGSTRYPPGMNSYTSPEERFISRTVQIEIINKR